jgi:hypothetical protein
MATALNHTGTAKRKQKKKEKKKKRKKVKKGGKEGGKMKKVVAITPINPGLMVWGIGRVEGSGIRVSGLGSRAEARYKRKRHRCR